MEYCIFVPIWVLDEFLIESLYKIAVIFEMRCISERPGQFCDLLFGTENTAHNVFIQVLNKVNFTGEKPKSPIAPRTETFYDFHKIS